MKKSTYISIFFLLLPVILLAQDKTIDFKIEGGELAPISNSSENPCISKEEYLKIEQELTANLKRLSLENSSNKSTLTTTLSWPLRRATGFSQCEYYFIGAYVDQNTATTSIQDFNCETNTYDGHQGTDIAIYPYGFYKMDNNQIEVVATAAGTIVQKADGNFDRNCSSNSLTANSIIIQHADGSYAYYWHMKNGSVTSKVVGQTVSTGEYLGIVGSSGSSTGPHLHFEIRTTTAITSYKDPFSGACNLLNTTSWWATQKPHTDPAILKVSVNTSDIALATCPTSDIPNESNSFAVPFQGAGLAAGYAKFYIFLREIPASTPIEMKIINPNGTVFNSWTYTIPTFYKISYWGFSKLLPTIPGTYTFQANYNNVSCSIPFNITNSLENEVFFNDEAVQISPNPINDLFTIKGQSIENGNYHYTLRSITGQIIDQQEITISNTKFNKSFSISDLSKGIYFITLRNEKSEIVKKIIKD